MPVVQRVVTMTYKRKLYEIRRGRQLCRQRDFKMKSKLETRQSKKSSQSQQMVKYLKTSQLICDQLRNQNNNKK